MLHLHLLATQRHHCNVHGSIGRQLFFKPERRENTFSMRFLHLFSAILRFAGDLAPANRTETPHPSNTTKLTGQDETRPKQICFFFSPDVAVLCSRGRRGCEGEAAVRPAQRQGLYRPCWAGVTASLRGRAPAELWHSQDMQPFPHRHPGLLSPPAVAPEGTHLLLINRRLSKPAADWTTGCRAPQTWFIYIIYKRYDEIKLYSNTMKQQKKLIWDNRTYQTIKSM